MLPQTITFVPNVTKFSNDEISIDLVAKDEWGNSYIIFIPHDVSYSTTFTHVVNPNRRWNFKGLTLAEAMEKINEK